MLLTITIPDGPLVGKRRVIACGDDAEIKQAILLAYSNNPTLEYRLVANHNGEQPGDLLESLATKKAPKRAAKKAVVPSQQYAPGSVEYWATYRRESWATFFRKWPTADAWIADHPGQFVGRVVNPPTSVEYFTTLGHNSRVTPNYSAIIDGWQTIPIPKNAVKWGSWKEAAAVTAEMHVDRYNEQKKATA